MQLNLKWSRSCRHPPMKKTLGWPWVKKFRIPDGNKTQSVQTLSNWETCHKVTFARFAVIPNQHTARMSIVESIVSDDKEHIAHSEFTRLICCFKETFCCSKSSIYSWKIIKCLTIVALLLFNAGLVNNWNLNKPIETCFLMKTPCHIETKMITFNIENCVWPKKRFMWPVHFFTSTLTNYIT